MTRGKRRASGELVRAYARSRAISERQLLAPGRRGRALLEQIGRLAPDPQPVLVCGETGTGKTLVAGLLHEQSGSPHPLRIVNCTALSDGLLAELLWELDRECDRTASVPASGPNESASSAPPTVLLDEVGELSLWCQAVLLRNLQGARSGRPKARFLAATHRDLDAMAAQGSFSRELLARLSVTRVLLAPLRARCDEIVPLALHFLRLALRASGASLISLDPELLDCLERYDWPGNVRELKNVVLGALAANESGTLSPADLPERVRPQAAPRFSR